jgi:lysophospholipase L1-like esterase
MRTLKVFFFGDSICVGQHVSIHKGWVTKTSAKLSELGEKYKRQVIVSNASANGRTTRQAMEQMPYEIQSQHVDILIVQFGMNDCSYWQSDQGHPRVSPKAFAANLEEIIARAFNFGVQKVLLNTNHPTGRDQQTMPFTDITYEQSNEQYNRIIREVATTSDLRVILNDVEKAFKTYARGNRDRFSELLLPSPDLLHPSERGHDLYFEVVYPVVESVVLELIAEKNQ